jgi:hypothetical protein
MLPLARLEGEPKSGAIFAYLFIPATLTVGDSIKVDKTKIIKTKVSLIAPYI